MTPSFYAEGLIETLKDIDNAIKSASQVMSPDKPLMKTLFDVRNDVLDKIRPWVEPLGLVLSQPNKGIGVWVIDNKTTKYYQFCGTTSSGGHLMVNLIRPKEAIEVIMGDFNKKFRLADPIEVKQHEEFLMSKIGRTSLVNIKTLPDADFTKLSVKVEPHEKMQSPVSKPSIDPTQCEFYMVTCTGQRGAKVRHTRYDLAEKEALRVANKMNHAAWVVGVVAKIEPEVKTTYNVKKKW